MATHATYHEVRPKREPLHLDPPSFIRLQDQDDYSSATPDSAVPDSALPAPSPDPQTVSPSGSELLENDDEKDPSSDPHRSRSVSSSKSDKEKRKRSRVTPEQLTHLERFFTHDRSPTAARRREISDLLGMHERQTQIWFQNRRAKAKLQDGKQKGRSRSVEVVPPPPDSPPQLSTGFQVDLHNLIHEDEPVTIIPCTDLSIGTWRRIATSVAKHDLVAYVCEVKRCLTWFIHSVGFGFKMEIPFETIIDTEFSNAAPGSGLASFLLSQPPLFFLENIGPPGPDGTPVRHWKRCSDWTEGQQASQVLRHDLIGSAVQLAHLLRNVHNCKTSDVPLRPPSYHSEQSTSPMATMELPLPPMAGLTGPGYHYQGDAVDSPPPPPDQSLFRKRSSYTGPGITTHSPGSVYSNDSDRPPPPYSAPSSVSYSQQQPYIATTRSAASSSYGDSIYGEYTPSELHHNVAPLAQSVEDQQYSDVPISHGLAPRPYSAQPVSPAFYNETGMMQQPYQADEQELRMRRSHSSTTLGQAVMQQHQYHDQRSASPPLLTTPYYPPPHLLGNMPTGHVNHPGSGSPTVLSGLPGIPDYGSHHC
ncbi:Homeobox protein Hox-B3 [Hypsizygus marmoreus]|uniref:Homeobox protein Hox-B3 n=1 Tax=Hypsizygus marmoreus TaxID=39966 RepID=A0A369KGW1_HYPMA|nr:Homeobox protein Hox-B3 [Hypsizygus marmoreus]